MTKRNRRTPEEIIAATTAKIKAMQKKLDMKEARDHPAAIVILDALAIVEKDEREAKKGLGNGPQSFDNRIQAHQLWIDEIMGLEELAKVTIANSMRKKKFLNSQLEDITKAIVNGNVDSLEHIQKVVSEELTNEPDSVQRAMNTLSALRSARQEFKEGTSG